MQVGPTARKANQDAALTDDNFRRDFDEQQTPRRWLTFPERVVPATAVEVATPCGFAQGLRRQVDGLD